MVDGARVAELSDLFERAEWCGHRVICGRGRPHPGARLTSRDTVEGLGHQTSLRRRASRWHWNGVTEATPVWRMASGRRRPWGTPSPFRDRCRNDRWTALVHDVTDLVACAKQLCLDAVSHRSEPERLHRAFSRSAARLVRNGRRFLLRIGRTRPWTEHLTASTFCRSNLAG